MSHNTFGHLFQVTTFGESHGACIGCVIDGCPPELPLSESDIQPFLDARRPGTSRYVTQRREPDTVRILSGTYDNGDGPRTTGTPICLMIDNVDQRSKDYSAIAKNYRPGHADFTYDVKYGIRDPRGGGRSSARETATRVAAGAVARIALGANIRLRSALARIGPHAVPVKEWDWDQVSANPFRCPHAAMAEIWAQYLEDVRHDGSSAGAIVHVEALGVPAGWGAPVYGKLDTEIAAALMSINAVKGVEIGAGFALVSMEGKTSTDQMRIGDNGPEFLSNYNGGILGGISTSQPITARIAVKPTSSVPTPRQTITSEGENTEIQTKGRHDPCVGIRAAPVAEAMLACTLLDHKLRHRGQTGR